MPDLSIVTGPVIADLLAGREHEVVEWVRETYLAHHAGRTVNPDSYFLRFPERPEARIIALPAQVGGEHEVTGLKWISSFPGNLRAGLPRASAVLILNDYETGFAYAVLESAHISAARTAASAALAAQELHDGLPTSVGIIGAGPIAATTYRFLDALKLGGQTVHCHDLDEARAARFAADLGAEYAVEAAAADRATTLGADLVLLATTAGTPHIPAGTVFAPHQTVLNVSLRDLAPEILLTTNNVLDDVEHCMKADTSPHLAEQLTGGRDFVDGSIGDLLAGSLTLDPDRATVFSPFGLGVLDLALGHRLHLLARGDGSSVEIADFSR